MSDSLYIRDGNGILKEFEVISGSTTSRIIPIHALTGSISTVLSSTDLALLTGSINAVSSAIGTFNQQLYQALSGGPVAMNVDIVAGDVNTITSSIDKVTAELKNLTLLSGSNGILVHGNVSASLDNGASAGDPLYVSVVNSGNLTASVSVSNWPTSQNVTASLTRGDSANNGIYVIPSGTISVTNSQYEYATTVDYKTGSSVESQTAWGQSIGGLTGPVTPGSIKSVIISNQLNNSLYLRLSNNAADPTTSLYTYCLDPYSTYECLNSNLNLWHRVLAHPSASSGIATITVTFK